jgi:hypothetical protein
MEDSKGWENKRGRMLESRGYENLNREDRMVSLCLFDVCSEVMKVGNWFGFLYSNCVENAKVGLCLVGFGSI